MQRGHTGPTAVCGAEPDSVSDLSDWQQVQLALQHRSSEITFIWLGGQLPGLLSSLQCEYWHHLWIKMVENVRQIKFWDIWFIVPTVQLIPLASG